MNEGHDTDISNYTHEELLDIVGLDKNTPLYEIEHRFIM